MMEHLFDTQRRKRRRMFSLTPAGNLGKQLKEFNPKPGRMAILPAATVWDKVLEAANGGDVSV